MLTEGTSYVVVLDEGGEPVGTAQPRRPLGAPRHVTGGDPSEPVIPDFGEASDCVQENRLFCPDWVRDNWDDVLQPALLQHIKLTVIAVAVGFVIAFACALVARRLRIFERPFDLDLGAPLHDPEPRALPAARPDHGAHA